MPSAIISIVVRDWMKPPFLIDILLNEEKIDSLNIFMLINTDC